MRQRDDGWPEDEWSSDPWDTDDLEVPSKGARAMQELISRLVLIGAVAASLMIGATGFVANDEYSLFYDLTHRDKIDLIVMGEHYGAVSLYWEREVARRYSDAIVVLGHGGQLGDEGPWCIQDQISQEITPVADVVKKLQARFPHRRIVLISCNPQHQYLNAHNVTYALDSVWFYPDQMLVTPLSVISGENYVGNIFDFVEN